VYGPVDLSKQRQMTLQAFPRIS